MKREGEYCLRNRRLGASRAGFVRASLVWRAVVAIGLLVGAVFTTPWAAGADAPRPPVTAVDDALSRSAGSLQLLAGAFDGREAIDGPGSDARFADDLVSRTSNTAGIASNGNELYLADLGNQAIRRISPLGVTTLAGKFRERGSADGKGGAARFNDPAGIAIDRMNMLYVADSGNNTIRKIAPDGSVTTFAGSAGAAGATDGIGAAARFNHPQGVAVGADGTVYVADRSNHTVRRIAPSGAVSTLAGESGNPGAADGEGRAARFTHPQGVAVDRAGNVYVTEEDNASIRKITPGGRVDTLVLRASAASWGEPKDSTVHLSGPNGILIEHDSELVVVETDANRIRRISAAGMVSNVAGNFENRGGAGDRDGPGLTARFRRPTAITVSPWGELWVVDAGNATVRSIRVTGRVSTVAGKARKYGSDAGGIDGAGADARFNFQTTHGASLAALATNARGEVFVAEPLSAVVRRIDPSGSVTTIAGVAGVKGSVDGAGRDARFFAPAAIATGRDGTIYVADAGNHTIRKIDSQGQVTTIAGEPGSAGNADGPGARSRFNSPSGLAVDSHGNLFVSDANNHTIRRIDPASVVTTVAGAAGVAGWVDGIASSVRFERPHQMAIDRNDNLYVVDGFGANLVRRISAAGVVTTPSETQWKRPPLPQWGAVKVTALAFGGVAVDGAGNLYVADTTEQTLWKVSPQGVVETIAGDPEWPGFGLGALPGRLDRVAGVALLGTTDVVLTSGNAVLRLNARR